MLSSEGRPHIYRVTGVPLDFTTEDLKNVLFERLPDDGEDHIQINADIVPNCVCHLVNTGLVSFHPETPSYLDPLNDGTKTFVHLRNSRTSRPLAIDKDMYGLTQLYATKPGEKIVADIVAVTGLAGHPYGSWQGTRDFPKMWLRDFLAKDFPNCRTMTYGYNSKMDSPGMHRTADYGLGFLSDLEIARTSPVEETRPLIFIGHSFGGIIVAQSLVRSMEMRPTRHGYDRLNSICRATRAVFFFGTPHRGLALPSNIINIIDKENFEERIALVESIGKDSVDGFLKITRRFDYKIYSFYETLPTRKIVRMADGSFRRAGEYHLAVDRESTLLDLDDANEHIAVHADHSGMAKFEARDSHPYPLIVEYIKKVLDALDGVNTLHPV